MARRDPYYWRCERKVAYSSWDEAERECLRVMDEGDRTHIEAYLCRFCPSWHIGHPPRASYAPLAVGRYDSASTPTAAPSG